MTQKYLSKANILMVDPMNLRKKHETWRALVVDNGVVRYNYFDDLSPKASEYLTKYIFDLEEGKNLAKGVKKGMRSYNYLVNARTRLRRIIRMMEHFSKKELLNFTEDDAYRFFREMSMGTIKNYRNEIFGGAHNQSRVFCVFWRWLMRVRQKEGIPMMNIVESVDNVCHNKPKWHHFKLKDVDIMAQKASSLFYRALIYFLFDSGIRAPKELMNVRACDITDVPNSSQLFLQIREDTSKTFGRKIKLMICSEVLRKYIIESGKKGEDFLFDKTYVVMHRVISYLAYKTLKIGTLRVQKSNYKYLVKDGVSMYDFRHNSVCHYLPIYKSENQMKYRYGWKKAAMIDYYSEYIGMKDTINDEDMIIDQSKAGVLLELEKEKQRVAILREQMNAQREDFELRMKKIEEMMLQRFADNFPGDKNEKVQGL